jgi:hypothetical protein
MDRQRRRSERREWQRIPIAIPVFVRGLDGQRKQSLEFSTLLNVSAGGALLASRRSAPRMSRLSLEIPFVPATGMSVPPSSARTIQSRVVRVVPLEGGMLLGLKFVRQLPL